MATLTLKPSVSSDDGRWSSDATFSSDSALAVFGYWTNTENTFVRFPNVTVPQGAYIRSAKVTVNAEGDSGTVCNARIYAVADDSAVAPTTYSQCQGLSLSTAYVDWDNVEAFSANTSYDSPDITSVIQETIDRSGWDSGNALIIVIKNNGSDNGAHRRIHTIDESAVVCPILTIEYLGVKAQPFIITSSLSAYNIDTPDSLGYAYEESTGGSAMDVAVKTGEVVAKNITQLKQMKYLYYDLNTHGKDVVITVYIDGTAQTNTITLNTTSRTRGRYEDIPDTWQGYRFSLDMTCEDVTDEDLEIYAPFAILYNPFGE